MATALITGASTGLGLEFAWQLATARHNLVLVARDAARLEEVAQSLRAAAGVQVEIIVADLAQAADVSRVADRIRAAAPGQNPIGLLVNNAGFGTHQPFVGGDLHQELQALDVMVRAVMVLSHAAAEQMTSRGRGAILNVASVAALSAHGTYSAAKAWVRTFTEGLAAELAGTGVTATALCPGLTHTEFHQRAGMDVSEVPSVAWLTAEQVVRVALADVRRGVVISTPSLRYQMVAAALRTLPRRVVRATSRRGDAAGYDSTSGG